MIDSIANTIGQSLGYLLGWIAYAFSDANDRRHVMSLGARDCHYGSLRG